MCGAAEIENKGWKGTMDRKINVKTVALLLAPLLLFLVLLVPYSWLNRNYIVEWFGCGCPTTDELGEIVPSFNANDFTEIFWLFISVCVTGISVFLSRKIPKEKMWLRVIYVIGMLVVSLVMTYQFCQMMMWR